MQALPADMLNIIASHHPSTYYAMAQVFRHLNTNQANMKRHFTAATVDEHKLGRNVIAYRLPDGSFAGPSVVCMDAEFGRIELWLDLDALPHRIDGPAIITQHHRDWYLYGVSQHRERCDIISCQCEQYVHLSHDNVRNLLQDSINNLLKHYSQHIRCFDKYVWQHKIEGGYLYQHGLNFAIDFPRYGQEVIDDTELEEYMSGKTWIKEIIKSEEYFIEPLINMRRGDGNRPQIGVLS